VNIVRGIAVCTYITKIIFFKFVIIKLEFEAAMVLNVRVSRVQSMPHQFLDNGGFRS